MPDFSINIIIKRWQQIQAAQYSAWLVWWAMFYTPALHDELRALRNCRNTDRGILDNVLRALEREGIDVK